MSNKNRVLLMVLVLFLAGAVSVRLMLPGRDGTAQDRVLRNARLEQATLRAEPLIRAVHAYVSAHGQPPPALRDLVPDYLQALPAPGLQECGSFEYRSLAHKQGAILWYDLGSRQGEPPAGEGRYGAGDPDHATLVFTLDLQQRVTGAVIERLPKGREALDFDPGRWHAGEQRMEMALALADTFRFEGMPRDVLERLLGAPHGSRAVRGAAWELRLPCPTGLLNHDALVYWPGGEYPVRLYGGVTEAIGSWVYVRS